MYIWSNRPTGAEWRLWMTAWKHQLSVHSVVLEGRCPSYPGPGTRPHPDWSLHVMNIHLRPWEWRQSVPLKRQWHYLHSQDAKNQVQNPHLWVDVHLTSIYRYHQLISWQIWGPETDNETPFVSNEYRPYPWLMDWPRDYTAFLSTWYSPRSETCGIWRSVTRLGATGSKWTSSFHVMSSHLFQDSFQYMNMRTFNVPRKLFPRGYRNEGCVFTRERPFEIFVVGQGQPVLWRRDTHGT